MAEGVRGVEGVTVPPAGKWELEPAHTIGVIRAAARRRHGHRPSA